MIYEVNIPDNYVQRLLDAAKDAEICPSDWIEEVIIAQLEKMAAMPKVNRFGEKG